MNTVDIVTNNGWPKRFTGVTSEFLARLEAHIIRKKWDVVIHVIEGPYIPVTPKYRC